MSDKKSKPLRDRIGDAIRGESNSVDADRIRELAQLLEETGLTEIEIEREGLRLRVARNLAPMGVQVAAQPMAPGAHAPDTKLQPAKRQGTVVTSPMVGTVYLSPQPGTPPFVKPGDNVTDGTLCIIEAMKTMNPVPAPVAGRIVEIYVHDAQPVEFGEPLMLIE
jgi:acetyl-CoA carboxylase biotin carboxyl carrier protein